MRTNNRRSSSPLPASLLIEGNQLRMGDYERKMEEMLTCPVCQDVFVDPRQLTCGHSLCTRCLENLWNFSSEMPFRCPDCRQEIIRVHTSYALKSIAEDFRQNRRKGASVIKVCCDCCRGPRKEAVKSCLKCEVSMCNEHAKDHQDLSVFRGHPLVNPVADLKKRKCPKHEDEVLKYYCSASRRYLCAVCAVESRQQSQITEACADLHRKLTEYTNQKFNLLSEQLRESVRSLKNLQEEIQQAKEKVKPAISPVSCVTLVMLCLWLIVLSYAYHFSMENKNLQEILHRQQKHMNHIFSNVAEAHMWDLDTASSLLKISNDLQTAERVATKISYPHEHTRFTDAPQVLSARCFSTGAHVWEVEVEGYWDIAVSYRSIDHRSKTSSAFGNNPQSWSLTHNNYGKLSAYHDRAKKVISGTLQSNRIVVMVDVERGNITFGSVGPTVTRLHEFKAKLTEPVCLGLGLYRVKPPSRATILRAS